MDESTPPPEPVRHPDADGAGSPEAPPPPYRLAGSASPLRRHPVRWTVAAAGLAAVLSVAGFGVIQAATAPTSGASAAAATVRGGSGPTSGTAGTAAGPPGHGSGAGGPGSTGAARGAKGTMPPGGKRGTPPGRGSGTVGNVTSISAGSITLTTAGQKVVVVRVTTSTVYKKGSTTTASTALEVGDVAMVTGTTSDGTVTATVVAFGAAPTGGPPGA